MPYVTTASSFHPGTRPSSSWEDMWHATVLPTVFAQAESADVVRDAGVRTLAAEALPLMGLGFPDDGRLLDVRQEGSAALWLTTG